MLSDIATKRAAIEAGGTELAFVHMREEAAAAPFFARFGLGGVARISDPLARLYQAFGLERGRIRQIAGPSVWRRGAAAFSKGHFPGAIVGDVFQMPGVFLVQHGAIVNSFRHEYSGQVPDYVALATCPLRAR